MTEGIWPGIWYLVFGPVLSWSGIEWGRVQPVLKEPAAAPKLWIPMRINLKHHPPLLNIISSLSRNIQNNDIIKKNVIFRRFWNKIQFFQISDLRFLAHKYLIPQKTNAWFHWKPLSPKKHIVSSVQIFLEGSYQGHFLLVQGKLSARAISANLKLSLYKVFVNLILFWKWNRGERSLLILF